MKRETYTIDSPYAGLQSLLAPADGINMFGRVAAVNDRTKSMRGAA
ncbi:hypothetical protein [Rhizobium sp. 2MFCol3.1]|nr:hypothetical protein [Rhizobium sp. 2MFCol3.1]